MHVAGVFDGSNSTTPLSIYVDGQLDAGATNNNGLPGGSAAPTVIRDTTANHLIGMRRDNNSPMDGMLDEVGIYNRALTQAEIFDISQGHVDIGSADFDNDGDVDGNDLAQWEGDFGLNGDSDADGDADSDGADFLAWQRQFTGDLGLAFSDDFSTDTTGNYLVTQTAPTGGPTASFVYDATGQRAEVVSQDNAGVIFSQNVTVTDTGTFNIDFTPTEKFPDDGKQWFRLVQDDNNYYEVFNNTGGVSGEIRKYVNHATIPVETVPFANKYTQNTDYTITISFTPTATTVNAYGENLTLAANSAQILVSSFEVKSVQQTAYFDNISLTDTVDMQAPDVPTNLGGAPFASTQIDLSWTAPNDDSGVVAGYRIFRGGAAGQGLALHATTSGSATTFSDTGLAESTPYSYTVKAFDAAGNLSGQSTLFEITTPAPDLTRPSVPAGLTATPISGFQIDLEWNASDDNIAVAGYRIYRDEGLFAITTNLTHRDQSLTPNTEYSYTVEAFDAADNLSGQSASVPKTTQVGTGKTHYIDDDVNNDFLNNGASPGNNTTGDGSFMTPWRTIQKAADVVVAGDTVIVKAGTYTASGTEVVRVHRGGNETDGFVRFVTFRSETPWGAKIDAGATANLFGFWVKNTVEYVRIEGFEIMNANHNGIKVDSGGSTESGTDHIEIIGNNIHDGIGPAGIAVHGTGIGRSTNVLIEGNFIHDNGDASFTTDNGTIEANDTRDHGIYISPLGAVVRNNIFATHKYGWGIQTSVGAENVEIYNNTFAYPNLNTEKGGHIILWQRNKNISIKNNIFFEPNDYAVGYLALDDSTGIVIENNLTTTPSIVEPGLPASSIQNNQKGIVSTTLFVNYVDPVNDPLPAVPADFQLQSSSPAIDTGTTLPNVPRDYNQAPRPQDGNGTSEAQHDIGAFEYVPSPLLAAQGEASGGHGPLIDASALAPIVEEATRRWQAGGFDTAALDNVDVTIGSLGGDQLAVHTGGGITIDADAAGYGWFVDRTSGRDNEYVSGTATRGVASRRMDLLTAVSHELGHALGLPHDANLTVMHDTLDVGQRRTAHEEEFGKASQAAKSDLFDAALTGLTNRNILSTRPQHSASALSHARFDQEALAALAQGFALDRRLHNDETRARLSSDDDHAYDLETTEWDRKEILDGLFTELDDELTPQLRDRPPND